jgi:hypothetical protein
LQAATAIEDLVYIVGGTDIQQLKQENADLRNGVRQLRNEIVRLQSRQQENDFGPSMYSAVSSAPDVRATLTRQAAKLLFLVHDRSGVVHRATAVGIRWARGGRSSGTVDWCIRRFASFEKRYKFREMSQFVIRHNNDQMVVRFTLLRSPSPMRGYIENTSKWRDQPPTLEVQVLDDDWLSIPITDVQWPITRAAS